MKTVKLVLRKKSKNCFVFNCKSWMTHKQKKQCYIAMISPTQWLKKCGTFKEHAEIPLKLNTEKNSCHQESDKKVAFLENSNPCRYDDD